MKMKASVVMFIGMLIVQVVAGFDKTCYGDCYHECIQSKNDGDEIDQDAGSNSNGVLIKIRCALKCHKKCDTPGGGGGGGEGGGGGGGGGGEGGGGGGEGGGHHSGGGGGEGGEGGHHGGGGGEGGEGGHHGGSGGGGEGGSEGGGEGGGHHGGGGGGGGGGEGGGKRCYGGCYHECMGHNDGGDQTNEPDPNGSYKKVRCAVKCHKECGEALLF